MISSLRNRLILGILIFLGIALLIYIAFLHPALRKEMLALEKEKITHCAQSVAVALNADILAATRELEAIASLDALKTLERSRTDPVLAAYDSTSTYFYMFTALNADGIIVSRPSTPERIGETRSTREYFQAVVTAGTTYIADIHVTKTGHFALTISTPILTSNGDFKGVLMGSLGLMDKNPWMYRQITDQDILSDHTTFMVSREGLLIAHSDENITIPSSGNIGTLDFSSHPSVKKALHKGHTVTDVMVENERFYSASAPINATGWTVFVLLPESHIMSKIHAQTNWFIAAAFIFFALFLSSALIATNRLFKPLALLTTSLKEFGKTGRADLVDIYGTDEISQSVRAFNRMILERMQSEEELQEINKIINLSPAVAFLWRNAQDWPVEYVSENVRELFGYTAEEFITGAVSYADIIFPLDLDRFNEEITNPAPSLSQDIVHEPYRIITKSGILKWLDDHTRIRRDDMGDITYYHGIVIDITERVRATRALIESENKHRTLLGNLPQKIFYKDKDSVYVLCNAQFAHDLKIAPEDIVGKTDFDLYPADLARKFQSNDRRVIQTGKSEDLEKFFPQNGQDYWINSIKTPIRDSNNTITGVLGIFWDITNRRRQEMALRTEKEFSETLLQNIPFGIMLVSSDRKIVSINPAGLKILGHKEDDVTGRICHQFVCPTAKGNCPIFDLEKKIENAERIALSASGLSIPILKNVVPIKIKDETFLLETFIDISERKELEAQLLQAQKMEAIGTLAGGFAHDINNSLQAISGYSQLLLRKTAPDDPDYKKLEIISNAAHKTSSLTRQLLTFSSKIESALKPVDLNRQIEQVVRLLEKTIPKMISIETDLDRNLHKILAEAFQIEQILMNLGLNARDAMPDGGRLFFTTENVSLNKTAAKTCNLSSGEYVRVTVSDTGTGMKPSIVKHIFDPFFTTKEVGKGTGLGLSMVYGIVQNHHGAILCKSKSGKGATFTIYLPIIAGEVFMLDDTAGTDESMPGGNETLLLVDDERTLLDFSQSLLEDHGYRTLTALDGEEALKIYLSTKDSIDLVLLDVNMPGMGGLKCLKKLLEISPHQKVIIATGYAKDSSSKDFLQAGAKDFISKPYRMEDLLVIVRKILDA